MPILTDLGAAEGGSVECFVPVCAVLFVVVAHDCKHANNLFGVHDDVGSAAFWRAEAGNTRMELTSLVVPEAPGFLKIRK